VTGLFQKRLNRFLCLVSINGRDEYAHLPNSGRQKELLTPGRRTILSEAQNLDRATKYTVHAVSFSNRWVCVDSTVANHVAAEMVRKGSLVLFNGYSDVKQEHVIGSHRFDLLLTGENLLPLVVEVKSATLVCRGGIATFPDAPTTRGTSHLKALSKMSCEGSACAIIFIVLRSDARTFTPNRKTDPNFADALIAARDSGVSINSVRCKVTKRAITVIDEIKVSLC